jgi:hypothetical protein
VIRRPSGVGTTDGIGRSAFCAVVTAVLAIGVVGLLSACMSAEAEPAEATHRAAVGGPRLEARSALVWHALADCESRGHWHINTGNGFTGGLQFLDSTWLANGGAEFAPSAYLATPEQQIIVGERLRASVGGFSHWPACAAALGLP